MKSLNIKLNLNGSISVKEVDSLFLNENNACEVSIDYSSVVKEGWNIAVDLQPQYEQATEINSTTPGFISDENNVFMFLLSENYTKRNELRIQPKQVKSNGVVMDKIKYDFYTKKFKQSINATESEEAVSQSIADQILASEQVRDTNENSRNQNEETRINSENSRIEAEELRVTNELLRQENEEARNVFESYNDSKQYVVGNKVSFNGSSYVCYITPPSTSISPTNEAYWLLAAQKGSDGYTPVKGTDYFDGDDGLSAYQVWLNAGNVGTEAQFLAKLKGSQWKGAYIPGTPYVVDDVVSYNGSSYICILASLGNLPTNTTYWSLFAQAGEVTTAQMNAALANKVDKVTGKGLSTNDYTTIEKNKVANLPDDTNAQLADIEKLTLPMVVPSRNLFDGKFESGYYNPSIGTPSASSAHQRSITFLPVDISKQYYLTRNNTNNGYVHFYNSSKVYISSSGFLGRQKFPINYSGITTPMLFPAGTAYIRFHADLGTTNVNNFLLWQVEEGIVGTEFVSHDDTGSSYDLMNDIIGSIQKVYFNTDGMVSKIEHIKSSIVIREDVYTYDDNLIIEKRKIIETGKTVTYTYNLSTFETEVKS